VRVLTGLGIAEHGLRNACAAVATLIALYRRFDRWQRIGLVWFLTCSAPVLKLLPIASMPFVLADRHLYVGSAGLALVAGSWLWRGLRGERRLVRGASLALLLAWAVLGWIRIMAYHDDASFWAFEARHAPLSYRLHQHLSWYHRGLKQPDRALVELERAISLERSIPELRRDLIDLLHQQRRCTEAVRAIRELKTLDAEFVLHSPGLSIVADECGEIDLGNELLTGCRSLPFQVGVPVQGPGRGVRGTRTPPLASPATGRMKLILDSGSLIALDRGDRAMWRRLKSALLAEQPPVTHGGVVGQAWRAGGPRQALLSRALRGMDVLPLDAALGKSAGELLARSGRSDVIDAALVLLARDGDQLITSDPGDLASLARAARRSVDVLLV
jgi:hypothetical protein